ncbi:MAG: LysM peptidoglycan-binding domain-containing protein [Rhodospirillaceae bacterium]|nr:LysM peptidoglycan-binding domain-containing protein [Rhodospirillaceae bacterium]
MSRNTSSLIVITVVFSIVTISMVVSRIWALEQQIEKLNHVNASRSEEHEKIQKHNVALQDRLKELEEELEIMQKPQTIEGPASFPVSRVLAQRNDTVADLSKRENTSIETIFELNSWLNGRDDLLPGQAIWIPNK